MRKFLPLPFVIYYLSTLNNYNWWVRWVSLHSSLPFIQPISCWPKSSPGGPTYLSTIHYVRSPSFYLFL